MSPYLVDCDWLFARLEDDDVSIVDASWYLPDMKRDGRAEYDAAHIPGAVFFDLDAIVDPGSTLPHTMPDAETFARMVGKLGISDTDTIVVYDGSGLFSAARVWWMFRTFGAAKVVVLDGGFPAWVEARLPVESGTAPLYPALFKTERNEGAVVSFENMRAIVKAGSHNVLDARPAGRFTGEVPEPRSGMRSGHMPGATSVPAASLVKNGKLRPVEELRGVFDAANVDLTQPAVTTCGSGVTAAIITLALETLGARDHQLYDGSWAEWGVRTDTPVETG